MAAKRAFISFDFDHDEDLRNLLVGQAKNPDTPFQIVDRSVREPMTGDWREKVRRRIQAVDVVIVLCGEHMSTATGVDAELRITQEDGDETERVVRNRRQLLRPTRSTTGPGRT